MSDPKSRYAPQGSQYDKLHPRKLSKKKGRRIRQFVTRRLEVLGCVLLPWLYCSYIRLVWSTSKISDNCSAVIGSVSNIQNNFIVATWHQEALTTPHVFRPFHAHALASTTTLGRLITALLEANNFKVFRGGRRRKIVLREMIHYMKANSNVIYGITVDGSKGPPRVLKRGACNIAKTCRVPIVLVCTQAKRALYANSWDRTALPLPFNQIKTEMVGPYWIDPKWNEADYDRFCDHIQNELLNLADYVDRALHDGVPSDHIHCDFPEDWRGNDWPDNTVGAPLGHWDLQTEHVPPWAQAQHS
jgi:lysophospholipid acyltransferase (LPLAT)-like uncharacterized protein